MLSMGGLRTYHSPTLCVRLTSCSISAALFSELQHRDVNVWHGNLGIERTGVSGVANQSTLKGNVQKMKSTQNSGTARPNLCQ